MSEGRSARQHFFGTAERQSDAGAQNDTRDNARGEDGEENAERPDALADRDGSGHGQGERQRRGGDGDHATPASRAVPTPDRASADAEDQHDGRTHQLIPREKSESTEKSVDDRDRRHDKPQQRVYAGAVQ